MSEKRQIVTVRLKPKMVQELDSMAEHHHLRRSEVIRALMMTGYSNPEGLKKMLARMKEDV